MQTTKKALAVTALLSIGLASANALGSEPAGVWVKVSKVVYEPDSTSPTRVQIHGALMLFDGGTGPTRPYPGYTPPAFGYVYYECPTGQTALCREEWQELAANIPKPDAECLGFGMTTLPTGTLRQPHSTAQAPDVYPIQNGVSPGYSPCQAIAQFLASEQGGAGGAGGETSSGGADTTAGGTATMAGGTATTAGKPATEGGAPAGSSGKPAVTGTAGTSSNGGATGGGPAAEGNGDANLPRDKRAVESQAAGCSIGEATGAASLLGLAGALSAFGLALARRNRRGR